MCKEEQEQEHQKPVAFSMKTRLNALQRLGKEKLLLKKSIVEPGGDKTNIRNWRAKRQNGCCTWLYQRRHPRATPGRTPASTAEQQWRCGRDGKRSSHRKSRPRSETRGERRKTTWHCSSLCSTGLCVSNWTQVTR